MFGAEASSTHQRSPVNWGSSPREDLLMRLLSSKNARLSSTWVNAVKDAHQARGARQADRGKCTLGSVFMAYGMPGVPGVSRMRSCASECIMRTRDDDGATGTIREVEALAHLTPAYSEEHSSAPRCVYGAAARESKLSRRDMSAKRTIKLALELQAHGRER